MSVPINKLATELDYCTDDLARIIGTATTTVAGWRHAGIGPQFVTLSQRRYAGNGKVGPQIIYLHSALEEFFGGRWPKGGKFINTARAAKLLGKSSLALRQMRHRGQEPTPVYLCGLVRYYAEDCVQPDATAM